MVAVLNAMSCMAQVRPASRGDMVARDDVMYSQEASLVHSPCRLMSVWSKSCL